MKQKLSALTLGSLLLLAAGQAFAASPSVTCVPGRCLFNNLKPYNNGAGQAVYYNCNPSAAQNVTMTNHSVLITGFSSGGTLKATGADVLKYSFAAYEDPNSTFLPNVSIVDSNSGSLISCQAGTAGRPVMPGPPQLP